MRTSLESLRTQDVVEGGVMDLGDWGYVVLCCKGVDGRRSGGQVLVLRFYLIFILYSSFFFPFFFPSSTFRFLKFPVIGSCGCEEGHQFEDK